MPAKRKTTRKQTKRGLPKAAGKLDGKKQSNPGLHLVLKRLDKIDQRLETFEQNTIAEFKVVRGEMAQGLQAVHGEMAQGLQTVRGEMAQGLQAVRGEMAQGLQTVRGEMAQGLQTVRGEMAQGFEAVRREFKSDMAKAFDSFHQEFKAEMQKEFEKHGAGIHQHISRVESELKTEMVKLRDNQRQLLTGLDAEARAHEQIRNDHLIIDAEHQDLKKAVETLKKRDMEKAAAIEKIEKDLDKLKAA